MGNDTLWNTNADPRRPQRRIAITPSGRTAWIEIKGDDRLAVIKRLPHRWPEVVMARETGATLEEIAGRFRVPLPPEHECQGECEPACLREHLATCYAFIETELNELAKRRARWLP